jgi:putative MATE family efflux protein
VSEPAPRAGSDGIATRPPELEPAAAFPLEPHQSIASVLITGEHVAAEPILVSGSLTRTVVRVGLPAVASSLLMTLFFTVDSYWIGTHVGATGLAAGSTSVFWIWMVVSVAEMVSIGLTAVAARRHGEGRAREAARIVGEALVFSLILGCVVAALGVLFVDELFALMHTPPEVSAMGRRYLTAYFIGSPLIYGFFAVDAAFRASGDTRTPFVLLAISVAVTLVLDPLLILGWWGAPRLGIAGAAIATVCTRGAAFVMGCALLVRRGMIRFGAVRAATIRAIARVGLPTATTGVVFGLIYVAITRTTTRFGTPALAALGIGHRVESWLYMVGVGFGAAAAAIVGQNLGARRVDRAERAGWIATGYGTAFGVLFCLLQLTLAERFASIFTNDPAVIAEGARYLRIASFSQLAITAEIVLEGALGGAGHTVPPMLTSTGITLLRVPVATWAAARWGTAGIWWTISLTAFARGVAMAALWRRGRWKRRSV